MNRVAIIAAMPGELKPLVRGWRRVPTGQRFTHKWVTTFGTYDAIAVCGGMGADAATRAFAQAEKEGPIDGVLSIGWAGALNEGGDPGDFHIPNIVVNAQTGERIKLAAREQDVVLVTTAHIAGEVEKRRLAEAYVGAIVDMESATVVRLAQMRRIPVVCMKIITDEIDANLPDLNPFVNAMGQMEMGRFVVYALTHPRYWLTLMRLGKASAAGAGYLASAVTNFLVCPSVRDVDEINRLGDIPDW